MLAHMQDHFAAALIDAERPIPAALTAHTTDRPTKRFAVYRNNVVVSLIDALRARFPATERIVGEEFFGATARVFATAHPPRSPLMMTYGDGFPDFIEHFAPAADLPYLADVARIEAARTRAYHAVDAAPIDPARLLALAPEALAGVCLTLHPSAELIRSAHPIVTIWAMNSGEMALAPITDGRAEDALVLRPAMDVEVRRLPPGGAAFLAALARGATLAAAAETALADDAGFDLAANLAGLFGTGLVTQLSPPPPKQDHAP
jgi:hypothetical protein